MSEPYWPDFNELWYYGAPERTEWLFRDMIPAAKERAGRSPESKSYYLQLLTQLARTQSLQKKFEAAHGLLDQVEAEMEQGSLVEIRYLLERGRTYNSAGDAGRSIPLFSRAVRIGKELGADFFTVDAMHMLGIAAPQPERLGWNLEAIAFAEGSEDEHARNWMGSLYNNTGWAVYDEGRYEEALELFLKAQTFRDVQGDQELVDVARWCVAKTLRMLGRVEEALAIQRDLEDPDDRDGYVEEEIAECLEALGKREEAQPYRAIANEILSQKK